MNTPFVSAFDTAYAAGIDAATAAINSADRPLAARLAAIPADLEILADDMAGGSSEVGQLARRGWIAGFHAAVLEGAASDPHFGNLLRAALNTARQIKPDSMQWVACSACGDRGTFVEYLDGEAGGPPRFTPVACGYCSSGKPVLQNASAIRAFYKARGMR